MRKPVLPYANNKGADQPVHAHSLISAFVIRCLDSIISLVSISKISSLQLVYVAEQAGLSHIWSQTTFSRDEARISGHLLYLFSLWFSMDQTAIQTQVPGPSRIHVVYQWNR